MKLFRVFILLLACFGVTFVAGDDDNVLMRFARFWGFFKKNEIFNKSEAIEVIGAGFGRTGTMSLKAALNILGYKTYHMDEVLANGHDDLIIDAFTGDKKKIKAWFDAMLEKGFTATVDFPSSTFYKEQMGLYPNAKVIFTTRDPEKWFKSWNTLMHSTAFFIGRPFSLFLDRQHFFNSTITSQTSPYGLGKSGCMGPTQDIEWFKPWYAPWIAYPVKFPLDKAKCVKAFNDHAAEVRRSVPKDKLYEMQVGEGWGPLAKLLGVPEPKVPYPSVNSGDSLENMQFYLKIVAHFYPFIFAGALVLVYMIARVVGRVVGRVFAPKQKKV